MQAIPSWRNILNVKGCAIIQLTTLASKSSSFFAGFYSSSPSYEKWKKAKSNPDVTAQKASKNHIRFQVRERRADAKKALRSLLLNGGSIHINVQAERDTSLDTDDSKPPFASRRAAKAQHKRMKRQRRREENYESDDADVFQAAFRKKGYKWASWSETDFSYESCTGFEWKEQPKRNFRRQRDSDIDSDIESDSESCVKDMYSERKTLDLPLTGPLKIEAIKTAFRVSALKWHPDKHQGPSQTMAEEKFKHCVDAYKSLCNSVSTA